MWGITRHRGRGSSVLSVVGRKRPRRMEGLFMGEGGTMIGYMIMVTLTGIITGVAMCIILGADGFFERTLAFILGVSAHLVLTLGLTTLAYRVIEIFGVIV